jgi:CRISPR/Cas system Type II protein with McrA/HNH and RuvC-like nuclease domain
MKDAKIAELSFLEVVPRLNGTKDLDDCLKEALERRRKVTRLLEVGKRNYEIIV